MYARPLPYAMKAKVDVELDRLIEEGILEPVEFSEWASPVVILMICLLLACHKRA